MRRIAVLTALVTGAWAPLVWAGPSGQHDRSGDRDGYRGFITVGSGPTHNASQGAGWTAVFKEREPGRVRYRVCLKHRDPPEVKRCWKERTGGGGRSTVFVALYVNDVGGPGRWRATWKVGGKPVEKWGFEVRPEGV